MIIDHRPGDEEFANLVAQDARSKIVINDAAWLRSPAVVHDWYDQIVLLINRVDAQMTHHRADRAAKRVELDDDAYEDYLAEAEKWRSQALWFKKALLDRLTEAKHLKRALATPASEVGSYIAPAAATAAS